MNTSVTAQLGSSGAQEQQPSLSDEDEAYEIGKRDGYEDAVQELDIFTGGDGEFKGSTLPGGTVDVPVMMARVKARFADAMSFADLRASGGIFPEAYAQSGQKIADIEILQQKLEFSEWEWNRATEGMKERDAKIALLESLVERARACAIEECANSLERKADLLTNSLHCGDNSATIAAAHKKSRQLYEAASIIRSLPSTERADG